jgi:hypothetical protein
MMQSYPAPLEAKMQRYYQSLSKSAFETIVGLDEAFLRVLERHTAGSPMDERVKYQPQATGDCHIAESGGH